MEPQAEQRRRRRPQPIVIDPEPEIKVHSVPVNSTPPPVNQVSIIDEQINEKPVKKHKVKKKPVKPRKVRTKRSFCQFLSAAILIAYTIFIIQYFFGASVDTSGETATVNLSGSIATLMVTPHMLFCTLASIFSAIAFFANSGGFALTAAILECVAAVLFIMYAPFLIPSIVLGFIGYARIGALKRKAERLKEEYP